MKIRYLFAYPCGICEPPVEIKRPIAPAVGAAIIGAGSSLLGGLMNGVSTSLSGSKALQATRETNENNRQIAADVNRANYDLYKEQYRDSLSMWNMENEYNSPVAQAARLREAGLNPALAFGGANVSNSAALPSASPAVGATMQQAPYEAYSDTFVKGLIDALPQIGASLGAIEDFKSKNLDNQSRSELNKLAIDNAKSDIDYKLSQKGVSDEQKRVLSSQYDSLNLANDLERAKYDDNISLSRLGVKYQELLNKSVDNQINVENQRTANDTARVAIQQLEASSGVKLSNAQIAQIQVLSNLAINQDWRDSQSHVSRMNLEALDYSLKKLNIGESKKQFLFNTIMRNSEIFHTKLKDNSKVNQIAEHMFGLGFRDVGNLLKGFAR